MLLVTDGITGSRKLKAYRSGDIAGIHFIQLLPLIGMHLKNTAHTLLLVFRRVIYIGTGIHGSGIYTEERKLSDKRVSHDLEGQSGERLLVRRVSLDLIAVHIGTLDCRNIGRRRHVFQNGIQKLLYAFVPVGAAAAYRYGGTLAGCFPKNSLHFFH